MSSDADRSATPRPGTVHPHLARERALKVLFQADVRGEDPRLVLDRVETTRGALALLDELEPDEDQVAGDEELQAELTRRARLPLDDYTRTLVGGVALHRWTIDRVLGEVAQRWAVDRMPLVDRNLLRLAVYELAGQDTPPAVVIDEAVSLAGGFAGGKARSFVNGVLETVRRRVAAGELVLDDEAPEEPPSLPDVGGTGERGGDVRAAGDRPRAGAGRDDRSGPGTPDDGPRDRPPAVAPADPEPTAADAGAWGAALDLLSDLDETDGYALPPGDDDPDAPVDDAATSEDALDHAEPLVLFEDEVDGSTDA